MSLPLAFALNFVEAIFFSSVLVTALAAKKVVVVMQAFGGVHVVFGAGAWQNGKKVTGLCTKAETKNYPVAIGGPGVKEN